MKTVFVTRWYIIGCICLSVVFVFVIQYWANTCEYVCTIMTSTSFYVETVKVVIVMQRGTELKWSLAGTPQLFDPYPAVGPRYAIPPLHGSGGKQPREPAWCLKGLWHFRDLQ